MERLFFALDFSISERTDLARWCDMQSFSHCRPVACDNLHLTLRFLGDAPIALRETLIRTAQSIVVPAFELALDQCGYWSSSRVAFIAPSAAPPSLLQLRAELEQLAQSLGFSAETRGFQPHVTLARHCQSKPQWEQSTIRCQINQFVLMRSVEGRYETLASFPLPL